MLEPFSISALGVFIATACLAVSGFVAAACKGMSHSRCCHVNACCMSCDREVMSPEELALENNVPVNTIPDTK